MPYQDEFLSSLPPRTATKSDIQRWIGSWFSDRDIMLANLSQPGETPLIVNEGDIALKDILQKLYYTGETLRDMHRLLMIQRLRFNGLPAYIADRLTFDINLALDQEKRANRLQEPQQNQDILHENLPGNDNRERSVSLVAQENQMEVHNNLLQFIESHAEPGQQPNAEHSPDARGVIDAAEESHASSTRSKSPEVKMEEESQAQAVHDEESEAMDLDSDPETMVIKEEIVPQTPKPLIYSTEEDAKVLLQRIETNIEKVNILSRKSSKSKNKKFEQDAKALLSEAENNLEEALAMATNLLKSSSYVKRLKKLKKSQEWKGKVSSLKRQPPAKRSVPSTITAPPMPHPEPIYLQMLKDQRLRFVSQAAFLLRHPCARRFSGLIEDWYRAWLKVKREEDPIIMVDGAPFMSDWDHYEYEVIPDDDLGFESDSDGFIKQKTPSKKQKKNSSTKRSTNNK